MRRVLLTKALSPELLELLSFQAELVQVQEGDTAAFERELPACEAILLSTAFRMGREQIAAAGRLRVISRTGVGVDNVDVEAATAAGVMVLNTPTANTVSVVEHTVGMILGITKQFAWLDRELRSGNFQIRRKNVGHDISGKTLGLLGCGRIGRMVAQAMSAAFQMQVIGYDPYPSASETIRYVETPDKVCQDADVLSIHLPLLPSTLNMMNRERLGLMKPTAYLVNTARGGIVDEIALAGQLNAGLLAGAALDVFAEEPVKTGHPLLSCPNTLLTPHAAALTYECNLRVAREAVQGIADYLAGKTPGAIVNPQTK